MNQYFDNNPNLKSNKRIIKYNYEDFYLAFYSDNGIFSKKNIDYASNLLVKTYLKENKKINNFLDVGCGYGFISITLSKILKVSGLGVDINKRALDLAIENNKLNATNMEFIISNIYENIHDKYDLIITNPPIRAGKKVVLDILKGSVNYLNKDGELWFVINKNQGAKSIIKELKDIYKIDVKEKSKGFYVFLAKRN